MAELANRLYRLINSDTGHGPTRRGDLQTCEIDGVEFHINPSSYSCVTERIHADVPTRAGFVRFAYGTRPPVYTLEGFTGTHGVDGIDAMDRFRPLVGRPERIVTFRYPNRFTQTKRVYVNRFEDSISSDLHLYNSYQIELVEYGDQPPSSVAKMAADAARQLDLVLVPGGGGGAVMVTPVPLPPVVDLSDPGEKLMASTRFYTWIRFDTVARVAARWYLEAGYTDVPTFVRFIRATNPSVQDWQAVPVGTRITLPYATN